MTDNINEATVVEEIENEATEAMSQEPERVVIFERRLKPCSLRQDTLFLTPLLPEPLI